MRPSQLAARLGEGAAFAVHAAIDASRTAGGACPRDGSRMRSIDDAGVEGCPRCLAVWIPDGVKADVDPATPRDAAR